MRMRFVFVIIVLPFIIACNKAPEACLSASESSVKIGQTVTFTDCSEKGVSYTLDFGDDTPEVDDELTHAYESSGSFTAKLTSYNKNERKNDQATVIIVVAPVTDNEIIGTWDHYKVESYEEDVWTGTSALASLYDPNETYDFSTDTLTVDNGVWAYDYQWDLNSGNELSIVSTIYFILKLYDGEMVLRQSTTTGYDLRYFKYDS